mmetsp:Transcript_12489/g.27579  ORF Transcript_12489/g.27579 Transcript_12489/m.27579 type:complete len:95 (+) Transcript_12489:86-370(+)
MMVSIECLTILSQLYIFQCTIHKLCRGHEILHRFFVQLGQLCADAHDSSQEINDVQFAGSGHLKKYAKRNSSLQNYYSKFERKKYIKNMERIRS